MHWTDDGRIQITRNFALGAAGVIIALALVMMLLIGMLISGNEDGNAGAEIAPDSDSVMASEQEGETTTSGLQASDQEEATEDPGKAPGWHENGILDVLGQGPEVAAPWIWRTPGIHALARLRGHHQGRCGKSSRYRYVDYIGDHCHGSGAGAADLARTRKPASPENFRPSTGDTSQRDADSENHRAIAAEYALTVCQPSAGKDST